MQFIKATKKKSKLRLALAGVSGSGKTYSALLLAKGIAESINGKIAVIDTERGSASLYSDICDFDVVELTAPYSPERYIEAIRAAEESGYGVLVIDSITHEWNGDGGVLDIVNVLSANKYRGNSYVAWREGTPRHQAFVDAILQSNLHVVVTTRSKSAYVEGENSSGKKTITKQGTEPQQRDGMEYEFTSWLDITKEHYALCDTTGKDRTRLFTEPTIISEKTGKMLLDWLNSGEEVKEVAMITPAQKTEIKSLLRSMNYRTMQIEQWFESKGAITEEQAAEIISKMKQAKKVVPKEDEDDGLLDKNTVMAALGGGDDDEVEELPEEDKKVKPAAKVKKNEKK